MQIQKKDLIMDKNLKITYKDWKEKKNLNKLRLSQNILYEQTKLYSIWLLHGN